MEDWEQFFQAKSRRRSSKERRERRRRVIEIAIGGAIVGLAILAGIMGLGAFD